MFSLHLHNEHIDIYRESIIDVEDMHMHLTNKTIFIITHGMYVFLTYFLIQTFIVSTELVGSLPFSKPGFAGISWGWRDCGL